MKPTLIIVEDVDSIRESLVAELEQDFTLLAAVKNGAEAVEVCQMHQPQLVLMDVVMPKMSGIEATRIILQNSENPPKIIMLSGMRDESIVYQAMAAGATDYLIKPMDGDRIRKILMSYLEIASEAQGVG